MFEALSLPGVGDTVGVDVGEMATFALLFALLLATTHPAASMQTAMKTADPKYCFIFCTFLLIAQPNGKVCAAGAGYLCALSYFSATSRKTSTPETNFTNVRDEKPKAQSKNDLFAVTYKRTVWQELLLKFALTPFRRDNLTFAAVDRD